MRRISAAIRLALVSLAAVISIGPLTGCAGPTAVETWISPISFSATVPGLEISTQLIDRLVVRTELSRSELKELDVEIGKISDVEIRKLLDLERKTDFKRYVDFFDRKFGDFSEQTESRIWRRVAKFEAFISDAISHGDFDQETADLLRKSLKNAAIEGDDPKEGIDPEQIEARTTAYQLLLEARHAAVRKARGYRQLVEALERELSGTEFEWIIELVVDIRSSINHPTISPITLVTMQCTEEHGGETIPTLMLHERRRECDEFGVCRVASVATEDEGPEYLALFRALNFGERSYLDGCSIITQMVIDGKEVVRVLPGKFTSHIAVQSQ